MAERRVAARALASSLGLVALTLTWIAMPSCTWLQKKEVVTKEEHFKSIHAQLLWRDGKTAFLKEDYRSALSAFSAISQDETASEELRRKALYGEACTRMILAQSPGEFQEALDLWDRWSQTAPAGALDEDPRMMAPLLRSIPPPGEAESTDASSSAEEAKAKMMSEEYEKCRRRVRDKEKQIMRLKGQIKELEEIHQSIQEKKKRATSP